MNDSRAAADALSVRLAPADPGVSLGASGRSRRRVARPVSFYARVLKRAVDVVTVVVVLVPLLPLFLVVALAVLVTMGRPVLFRQSRVGLAGVPFQVLKFRTMRPDRRVSQVPVELDRRRYHKSEDDPRHTGVGRFLRRTSLDELPQLFNVLRGDMSLVGPRPELTEVVDGYEPWQHDRHLVRPGLTGLWQVSARGEGMMHEFTHVDIDYIERFGMKADLMIVLRTVPVLLARRGG